MPRIIPYSALPNADLFVDAVYEGDAGGQLVGEALSRLLPGIGNRGGFRAAGRGERKSLVILYTSGEDPDWPDNLDTSTGKFSYFGDNKSPGHELHDTRRGGNMILRRAFDNLHGTPPDRASIPPFLVFQKYATPISSRSVQFKGLAIPGFPGLTSNADLVAVWKTTEGKRFQNYQAVFTVLDVAVVPRAWLADVAAGSPMSANAPGTWTEWVRTGRSRPLCAESTTVIRSQEAQTPETDAKKSILGIVYSHFENSPHSFEFFAARIFQMHDQRAIVDEITRGSVDGGRDAVGRYLLGLSDDPVYAEFSLEAKCYRPPLDDRGPNTVGIREVSRLISRIRHRQFGVLVTTSVIARQAYEEVREDRHPIIFLSGKDIADILVTHGYNTLDSVRAFLHTEFPLE
ncbi:restriction endonuclease [Nordella sp. HKS 07]|uniref:restriction endonuclease n=1 Tax=Nordella sp. HKS 07 TaxID=2712222 RepID=UPI0013E14E97|nr:restriction endonuclease [Nordella sp. HKS 07]QIG49472.1 restriction endonuclease [Nordella sp. HKS 07]